MAKKIKNVKNTTASKSRLLPFLFFLLFFGSLGWLWQSDYAANLKDKVFHYIDNEEVATFETNYLPDQILQAHRLELLGNQKKTIRNTLIKYYPYLLLDVKFQENGGKTKEGFILWGMNDGELVLNTEKWEKTHGFRDCLECRAKRSDFKILQTLANHQGKITIDELQKEFQLEREVLYSWIESAKENHLITQTGNTLSLHFENPKLLATPQSKITQQIVLKPQLDGIKIPRSYTKSQIIEMAKESFGNHLKIRKEEEVFLPVYAFEVLNPDGSIQVSEWNSLTGEKILPSYLLQKL